MTEPQEEYIDHFTKLRDHADIEINRVWTAYRNLSILLGFIVATGLGMGGYLYKKSLDEVKQKIDNVGKKGIAKIEAQFKGEKIEKLVEKIAIETITDVAKTEIKKQVGLEVKKTIASYNEVLSVLTLSTRAQSGDRFAFEELRKKIGSENKDVAKIARTTVNDIIASYSYRAIFITTSIKMGDKPGEKLDLPILIKGLNNPNPRIRKGILDTLFNKNDKLAVPAIIELLKKEDDLTVCEHAIRTLSKLTGQKPKPLDFDFWNQWWEREKGHFLKEKT